MIAITSPFLGPFVDKIGKRRMFILVNCSFFATTHFLFGFLKSGEHGSPNWLSIIPLIMLGMCYSMYCCILIPTV
jgi:MFS family permease